MQETLVQFLGQEDPLEKEQATHSSIHGLPCGSDGKESARNVGDLGSIPELEDPLEKGKATHSSIFTWRIPKDRGARWATVHGVAKSQTKQQSTAGHIHEIRQGL